MSLEDYTDDEDNPTDDRPRIVATRQSSNSGSIRTGAARRSTDSHHVRLTLLEKQVETLEMDVHEHKLLSQKMCDILDEIRLDLSGAKGFLKAAVIAGSILVLLVSALWTMQWIKIPHL